MIKSMTAFAKQQTQSEMGMINWEVRSVNQRFFDINFRMPEQFRDLEWPLRELAKKYIQRGKIDVTLRYQADVQLSQELSLNKKVLNNLAQVLKEAASHFEKPLEMDAIKLLSWPGVLLVNEADIALVKQKMIDDFTLALKELGQTRQREGEKLAELIVARLDGMEKQVVKVREAMPQLIQEQKNRLTEKLQDLQVNCLPERLEQEVALLVQKSDVMEELDRLQTHMGEMRRVLSVDDQAGRRLDFLAQEMHREANTLGAKSIHMVTSQASLELKVLIEQIREQVQNIE